MKTQKYKTKHCSKSIACILLLCLFFLPTNSFARSLNLAFASNISSLDPIAQDDLTAASLVVQVYEGLFGFDRAGRVEPKLVSDWSVSENSKVYTFTLKKGIQFSNGRELNAHMVKASFERLALKQSLNAWVLEMISGYDSFITGSSAHLTGIKALGPDIVQIQLKRPFPAFLALLSSAYLRVVLPSEDVAKDGCPALIGTGPYQCAQLVPNQQVTLMRNPYYHGALNNIEKIVYIKMSHQRAVEAFNRKEIDLLRYYDNTIPLSRTDTQEINGYQFSTWYFAFNVSHAPGNDKNFRAQVAQVLQKDKIAALSGRPVTPAQGMIPNGFLIDDQHEASKEENLAVKGNPQKQKIDALFCSSTPRIEDIIAYVKERLESVGFSVNVILKKFPEYYQLRRSGHFTLAFANVAPDYGDPDAILYPYFYSKSSASITKHQDHLLDSLILSSREEMNTEVRSRLIKKTNDYLNQQHYVIPLFHDNIRMLIDKNLDIPPVSGLGPWFLEYNNIRWN